MIGRRRVVKQGDWINTDRGPGQIEVTFGDGSAYVGLANTGEEVSKKRLAEWGYEVDDARDRLAAVE